MVYGRSAGVSCWGIGITPTRGTALGQSRSRRSVFRRRRSRSCGRSASTDRIPTTAIPWEHYAGAKDDSRRRPLHTPARPAPRSQPARGLARNWHLPPRPGRSQRCRFTPEAAFGAAPQRRRSAVRTRRGPACSRLPWVCRSGPSCQPHPTGAGAWGVRIAPGIRACGCCGRKRWGGMWGPVLDEARACLLRWIGAGSC